MGSSFDSAGDNRRKWIFIGGGCLLAFVFICVAAIAAVLLASDATIAQLSQFLGLRTSASAIDFIPADAPVYVDINPNFATLASFRKLQTVFDASPEFRKRIEELGKQGAGQGKEGDFNLERDVLPWIGGDAGLAVFELPAASPATAMSVTPKVVFLASTRDKVKSDEALARFRNVQETLGYVFGEETYQGSVLSIGTKKATGRSTTDQVVVFTTNRGQVLVGTDAATVKKAIDTKASGDKASLKTKAAYNSIIAKLPKDRAITLVTDFKTLAQTTGTGMTSNPNLSELGAYSGLGMSLSFAEDGLRLDSVLGFDSAKASSAMRALIAGVGTNPNRAQAGVPLNAIVSLGGQNAKAVWDYYYETMGRDDQTKRQMDQGLSSIKAETGLDVNDDILSWMTGEYALAIVPANVIQALGPGAPAAGIQLMFEAKDEAGMRAKLAKLTQTLGRQGLQFANKRVNGVEMQVVKGLEPQGITIGYGFVEGFLVIGTAEDVLGNAIDARKSPLTGNAEYAAATKNLPANNNGVGFVNIGRLVELLRATLGRTQQDSFDKEVAPFLKPFKSIGIASTAAKDGYQNTVIFVHVAE